MASWEVLHPPLWQRIFWNIRGDSWHSKDLETTINFSPEKWLEAVDEESIGIPWRVAELESWWQSSELRTWSCCHQKSSAETIFTHKYWNRGKAWWLQSNFRSISKLCFPEWAWFLAASFPQPHEGRGLCAKIRPFHYLLIGDLGELNWTLCESQNVHCLFGLQRPRTLMQSPSLFLHQEQTLAIKQNTLPHWVWSIHIFASWEASRDLLASG